MANPNIVSTASIYGKTVASELPTTAAVVLLSNPASSGRLFKVNTINVANLSSSQATITIKWHNAADGAGTGYAIVSSVYVPGNSTLNVVDKSTQYYVEEGRSISAQAGSANALAVTASYEDLG